MLTLTCTRNAPCLPGARDGLIKLWRVGRCADAEHDPALANLARATTLRVAAIDGAIILEDSARPSGSPIVSLPLMPVVDGDRFRLAIGTARIGRLPVPGSGSALAAYLRTSRDELSSGAAEIRLSDRRRVALRAVSCQPGELRLLFATLPAASP